MNLPRTILGFDYGLRNIGVAVGQELTNTANGLAVVTARDGIPNRDDIEALIKEWKPQLLVVGMAHNLDGTEQRMSLASKKFGHRLNGRFQLPVEWQDECLTTFEALEYLGISSKLHAKQREDVDRISAQIILQSWLNEQ